jgi:hypothetical protein
LGSSLLQIKAPASIATGVGVSFAQGGSEYCLTYAVASAMRYAGLRTEAQKVEHAGSMKQLPGDVALAKIVQLIRECAPQIGGYRAFNNTKKKKKAAHKMDLDDLIRDKTPCLTIVQPMGRDGSQDHIVTVVDDLVFDTRLTVALKLSHAAFQWICGEQGFWKLGRVYRFFESHNTSKKFPERTMQRNW